MKTKIKKAVPSEKGAAQTNSGKKELVLAGNPVKSVKMKTEQSEELSRKVWILRFEDGAFLKVDRARRKCDGGLYCRVQWERLKLDHRPHFYEWLNSLSLELEQDFDAHFGRYYFIDENTPWTSKEVVKAWEEWMISKSPKHKKKN